MEIVSAFIYAYLEWVVAGVGGVGVVTYIMTRKTHDHSNNLTPYVVKYNRHKEAISKQTK
jgi:hypothetical protein